MVKEIYTIKNLNKIKIHNHRGIYKRCLLRDQDDHQKLCDCMQKINYCIQDLNNELENIENLNIKTIVYIITLTDWISDAMINIRNLFKEDIIQNFVFSKQQDLKIQYEFLRALRSFVAAHPLSTDRHPKFNMNGDLICIDIYPHLPPYLMLKEEQKYYLDTNGLQHGESNKSNYFLKAYNTNYKEMKISIYIGCNIYDLYSVAKLYIDKLYELDKFLSKQKCQ